MLLEAHHAATDDSLLLHDFPDTAEYDLPEPR
jgi:hypothetical protein